MLAHFRRLAIGTRGSPLALAQANLVRDALLRDYPADAADMVALKLIRTTGDRITDRPLLEAGGKGLFTKEIDDALLAGEIDLAVHSMKDVPTLLPEGIIIAAFLPREDPRDVLISPGRGRLADLPAGAVLGTASLRRQAQVLARRPDLTVVPMRGNVGTRLDKLERGEVDATLLARAGLNRLGMAPANAVTLEPDEMLPAVAQGAVGIACRADDTGLRETLAAIDDPPTRICVGAERAMLAALDGSCRTPIAALAQLAADRIALRGLVASPDGRQVAEGSREGRADDVLRIGDELGRELLSRGVDVWVGSA